MPRRGGDGRTVTRVGEAASIRVLLACMATIGIILVFRVPPMGGFDEAFHWRRALQVAALHPLARRLGPNDWGGRLDARALAFEARADGAIASGAPMSVAELAALSEGLSQAPRRPVVVSFPSTASFSPLAYLPAASGIVAARMLHLGPLSQLHAGRLANLLAYLTLVWCVVRVLPLGRLAALALLTGPTALHLASSFSADPLCNALPALLAACCLRLHLCPDRLPPRGWRLGLIVLLVLVGLLKPIGFVLSGLVLLVPSGCFASGRAGRLFRVAAVAACCATTLGWTLAYPFVPGRYWHTGAQPHAAVQAMLRAPLHAASVLLRNGWNDRWFWWVDGWGRYGGGPGPYHFTVPASLAGVFLSAVLALAAADRPGSQPARPAAAALLALLASGYVALLLLAFRIGYGPPLSDFIDGVQGRYLLLPELLLLLSLVLVLPPWVRAVRLAPVLLAGCLLPDLGAAVVALGHFAGLWH